MQDHAVVADRPARLGGRERHRDEVGADRNVGKHRRLEEIASVADAMPAGCQPAAMLHGVEKIEA